MPKDQFVRLMKGIVGDQMLRLALTKVQLQVGREHDLFSVRDGFLILDVMVMLSIVFLYCYRQDPTQDPLGSSILL